MTHYQDDGDEDRNSFSQNGHLEHGGGGRSSDAGSRAEGGGPGPPPEDSHASYPLRKLRAGDAELEDPDEEQGLEDSVGDVVPGYLYRMEAVENGRLQKQIREVQEKNERLKRDYERLKSRVDRAPEPADYEPFPVSRLPTTAQKVVRSISAAQDVENAFVAVPLLSVLGSAVGASARVRLKAGWKEPAMVWTALVAYSGAGKTPVFRSLVSAVQEKEMEAKKDYDRRKRNYDPDSDEPKPVRTRYLVNDVNPEKVTRILGQNTRGVLLHRDELAAWLGGMNKYSDGQDELQFWIKGWDGDFFSYDRVSAGTITVSNPSVSIAGGIQPGILKKHISDTHIESGFLARCILCQPPTSPSGWTEAEFTREVRNRYSDLITTLYDLKTKMDEGGDPFEVELSPEAKAVWVPFYEEADRHQYQEPGGPIKALLGKHVAYAARFALIFHLCRVADGEREPGPVDAGTMSDGIEVAKWCLEETIRVYQSLDLGMAAKTPKERFLRRMGSTFTTSDAHEQAGPMDVTKRTIRNWIKDLQKSGKLEKINRGLYRKTI
jgi:hypothetical protein